MKCFATAKPKLENFMFGPIKKNIKKLHNYFEFRYEYDRSYNQRVDRAGKYNSKPWIWRIHEF